MARKILVPIDLAHESSWREVLPEAVRQASVADGGAITILTVVPEIPAGLDWRYAIRGETGGSEELDVEGLLQDARTRLEQIGREALPADTSFDVIARYGTVYEEILRVAEELGVEQIVMAAHRPTLSEYLLGPNTARVVRHARCSVQVVRR